MANGATIGAIRKLKDTAGNYLYQVGVGQPDTFAGFNVLENPHVADTAVDALSVFFGHFPSVKVRIAGGIDVASSQDYAFNQNLTTWRFVMRLDSQSHSRISHQVFQGWS
jgi:HK97 family phage major capsid protein